MTLTDDIRILSAAKLFDQLSDEQLRLLAFGAERLRFDIGRTLYRQDDRAECGYVVAAGAVALTRRSNGDEAVVKSIGPGGVLGQLALITETHWMTGAYAETETEVLRINRSLFRRMLAEYPETALAIHAQLSADLKTFVDEIVQVEDKLKNATDL